MKEKVLISFSSFNAPYFLEHLVTSIEQHDAGYPYDLLILDNTSTDSRQLEILEKYSKNYRVAQKPNWGRAQGGYSYVWQNNKDYKYYFFMHDDSSVLSDGWLKHTVDRIEDKSVEKCLLGTGVENLPVGKVGFECYEWGNKYQYLRTGFPQIFGYMDPIAKILSIDIPQYYQHINDDRFLIKNELLQKMDKIWNVEDWKQYENQGSETWEKINNWFEKHLPNKTSFYPEPRYGSKYHAFQTVSEFLNDTAPMRYGYRTHCIEADGYCQEELSWSRFWGNNFIAHWGSHVVFKRLALLLNTTEEVIRGRYKDKTFLHYCANIIKRESKHG